MSARRARRRGRRAPASAVGVQPRRRRSRRCRRRRRAVDAGRRASTVPHGDHNPHFGGLVLMNGDLHFEVVLVATAARASTSATRPRNELPAATASEVTVTITQKSQAPEIVALHIDESGESWVGSRQSGGRSGGDGAGRLHVARQAILHRCAVTRRPSERRGPRQRDHTEQRSSREQPTRIHSPFLRCSVLTRCLRILRLLSGAAIIAAPACDAHPRASLDDDARQYVRLAVALGERDPDSLDFYAGPADAVADMRRNPPPLTAIKRDAADALCADPGASRSRSGREDAGRRRWCAISRRSSRASIC